MSLIKNMTSANSSGHYPNNQTTNALHLGDLLLVLKRRWRTIGLFVLVGVLLSGLIAFLMEPIYRATASVLIEAQQNRVVETQSVVADAPHDKTMLTTQLQLLKSRSFARRIAAIMELEKDPNFNPALRSEDEVDVVDAEGLDGLVRRLPVMAELMPKSWLIATGLAETVDQADTASSGADRTEELVINRLLAGINVSQAGDSYILSVSFESEEPKEALTMANAIAELYVKDQLNTKKEATDEASVWLKERVDDLRNKVVESERTVAQYRADNSLIDVRNSPLDDQLLTTLTNELIVAEASMAERETKLEILNKVRDEKGGTGSVSEVLVSPVIGSLRAQEIDLARREAQLSEEFGENHPRIIELQSEKQRITSKIDLELENIASVLRNEVSVAKSRLSTIKAKMDAARGQVGDNRQAQVQLNELEREAEANRQLYRTYLNRLKELSQQQDLLRPGARVVSEAVMPKEPAFPQPLMMLPVGFISSLLFGSLVAFLMEGLERGLRSDRQVETALGIPCIGVVPKATNRKSSESFQDYLQRRPRSSYAESLREIRLALRTRRSEDRRGRVTMMTSSLPGEGKSTLAFSLATMCAMSGDKTILVDLDFRNPSVRNHLAGPQKQKKGDLLTLLSEEMPFEKSVTRVAKNLDVLANNSVDGSAIKYLDSGELTDLLNWLCTEYDEVVVDAPPILGITDSKLVVPLADVILFVIKWGSTDDTTALNGLHVLEQIREGSDSDATFRAVLSQVDMKRHAKLAYGDSAQHYGKFDKYYYE